MQNYKLFDLFAHIFVFSNLPGSIDWNLIPNLLMGFGKPATIDIYSVDINKCILQNFKSLDLLGICL